MNKNDKTIMTVKITSSALDSVPVDKVYPVFKDSENDERYIMDENGRKVSFDGCLGGWTF